MTKNGAVMDQQKSGAGDQTNTAALAKAQPERTPSVITTPAEYQQALEKWQAQHFNILTPFVTFTGLQEGYGLVASKVNIDPDPDKGEVYGGAKPDGSPKVPWLKSDEVALAKVGLRKLAECAGISTETIRTDTRTIPYYWEFKAIASWRGIDGTVIRREASFEWDLRDGSDRLKGWRPDQITENRKNGLRNCETRAVNAAIREYGVKQKYTKADIARPFVVVRAMFQPDMNDPDVRRMVAAHNLAGTSALYAPQRSALPAAAVDDAIDVTPTRERETVPASRTASSASAAAASVQGAPSTATPNPDQPPTPTAVRIVDVKLAGSGTRKDKSVWTRWDVTDHNGEVLSTFEETVAAFATKAKAVGQWVEYTKETDGQYTNIVEIAPAGQQPSLLPDPGNL